MGGWSACTRRRREREREREGEREGEEELQQTEGKRELKAR